MTYFMGLDLGTSAIKCILVDEAGTVIGSHSVEYPLQQPHPGWAEQHPEDWWNATIAGIQGLLANTGISGDAVAGVGFSGQMHGSVFLDQGSRSSGLRCYGATSAPRSNAPTSRQPSAKPSSAASLAIGR